MQYYIGTSGWHYEHWRGRFYPEKLTRAKWLEFYAGHFTAVEILHKYSMGFCIFDMPFLACPLIATADFAYIRFHGSSGVYFSCYSDEELADWAKRLANLAVNLKAAYIYFNNDTETFAVRNAVTIGDYLQATV